MNILVRLLPGNLPVFLCKKILVTLARITAGAFDCPAPVFARLPYRECLRGYARFTREQAELVIRTGRDPAVVKARLFAQAYPLGKKLRESFHIHTTTEVMRFAQVLYRAIGVDIHGTPQGELTVDGCYYTCFYSAPVCDLISALDDGVFAGLSGGSRLVFTQRLTEGRRCCRAGLKPALEVNP